MYTHTWASNNGDSGTETGSTPSTFPSEVVDVVKVDEVVGILWPRRGGMGDLDNRAARVFRPENEW